MRATNAESEAPPQIVTPPSAPDAQLSEVIHTLDRGVFSDILVVLKMLSAGEIADLLESVPLKVRAGILELVQNDERFASILSELHSDVRAALLQDMDVSELAEAGDELEADDFADILQELPEQIATQVLNRMNAKDRDRLERLLSYPEDSAGGLMVTDAITVRPRHSLQLVNRYLRRVGPLPNTTDQLVVTNDNDHYVGMLPVNMLLSLKPEIHVEDVMDTNCKPLSPTLNKRDVAHIFARDNLISAPVVDDEGTLLGRITIDDVVDVLLTDADESLLGLSGVHVEADTFAPLATTMRSRGVWLGINLITACTAAAVIHAFEESIAQLVSLAVLLPVVASMGGVAGTQTLTLVVRGMAVNQVFSANLRWVIGRELLIGVLGGLLWATVIGSGIGLIFNSMLLGAVSGGAIALTLVTAALAGATLPYLLEKIGIDPAIAGSVILTTLTDVVGFLSFLGLATALLIQNS